MLKGLLPKKYFIIGFFGDTPKITILSSLAWLTIEFTAEPLINFVEAFILFFKNLSFVFKRIFSTFSIDFLPSGTETISTSSYKILQN